MHKFYLYYSYVSMVVFISASIVFYCVYGNVLGGIWAAAAAVVSGCCGVLQSFHFANKLQNYWTTKILNYLNIVSFIISLISVAFMLWYVFSMVYWKILWADYKTTPVFPCVFSFVTGKWSHILYMITKEYAEELTSTYSPLIESA